MAYNYCSILAFLFILNLLAGSAFAGRGISQTTSKIVDKKQPESFIGEDGTVLVPGLGRYYLFPRPGTNFNPFTYNPVTGTSGGTGAPLPGTGGNIGSGGTGSYVPGGDDTFVPNPGVEVPNPSGGSAGSLPPPANP